MRKDDARLWFSPSDLINFMGSDFVTWMDRFYKECPGVIVPDPDSEEQKFIQEKGLEHERAFLGILAAHGKRVCDLSGAWDQAEATLAAMRRGEEIIYQGYLTFDDFAGYGRIRAWLNTWMLLKMWRRSPQESTCFGAAEGFGANRRADSPVAVTSD